MDKQCFCGASRGDITPAEELIPNLRGLRNCRFGGVLDELFVRAIAVSDGTQQALLIAFDLDKAPYPAENLARIASHTGIPEESIFLFSTHTHTAPVTGFRPEEPINNVRLKAVEVREATAQYEEWVMETLLRVVGEAVGNMRPARMGYAYEKSYLNVNRNQDYEILDEQGIRLECGLGVNFQAPVDRTLFVMKFEDLNGQPIAIFMNYPVHNCVMIDNDCCNGKVGIGGDMIGQVCRLLETKFFGSTAIWSSGAAGDVNPVILNEIFYPDPQTGCPVESRVGDGITNLREMLAARHFADVTKALRKIVCTTESLSIAGTVAWAFTPGRNVIMREDVTPEVVVGEGVAPYEVRLHLVKLGDIALYGFSGELYSSLGQRIKDISPLENTILINHDASFIARSGYIFDDETLARDIANRLPGHRSSHMLPGYILETLEKQTLEMFRQLENRG